jgi:hypothetical protein
MRGAGDVGVARKARRATANVKKVKAVIVGLRDERLAIFARHASESMAYR